MERHEYDEFSTIMQEMASMYRGVMFNDFFVSGYWRILKRYPMGAIRQAVLQLLGDEQRKEGMPSAAEIKSLARRHEGRTREETFIPCQQPGCTELVPWPPKLEGEHTMLCGFHQPQHEHPATLEERMAHAAHLTPKGRAFLRSACPHLLDGIPETPEEAEFADPDEWPRRRTIPEQPSRTWVEKVYGATPEELDAAQARATIETMEPLV